MLFSSKEVLGVASSNGFSKGKGVSSSSTSSVERAAEGCKSSESLVFWRSLNPFPPIVWAKFTILCTISWYSALLEFFLGGTTSGKTLPQQAFKVDSLILTQDP